MSNDQPTTAEGWDRLADNHFAYANRERLGHLATAARRAGSQCREQAEKLRQGGRR